MQPNNNQEASDLTSQLFPKRANQVTKPVFGEAGSAPVVKEVVVNEPTIVPSARMSNMTPPRIFSGQTKSSKSLWIVLLIIIVVLLGAGVVWGVMKGVGPFGNPPYDEDSLAKSIVAGIGKLKNASYSLNIKVYSEAKESDAEALSVAVPVDQKKVDAYKRDQDKLRDIKDLVSKLNTYYSNNGKYPTTLGAIEGSSKYSSSVISYTTKESQKDFSFVVEFETIEAADYLNSRSFSQEKKSSGKQVTFDKSSSYYFSLPTEMKQTGLMNVVGMQEYLSYIPADFKLDGTLSGSSERVGEKSLNNHFVIGGNATANGMNVSANFEFKNIADTYYVMVKEFPSLFFDISKLKDKWIKITAKDATSYGGSYFGLDSEESEKSLEETKKRSAEQVKTFLEIADRNKALLSNGNPVKDSVSGRTAYRYNLEFNKETMVKFYTELTQSFGGTYGDKNPIKFDESTLEYLKSPEFDQVFEHMRKNTTLILWADASGIPVQLQYSLRMVPTGKNSDKQIMFVATITLDDINKSVKIEAPKESLTVEEVTLLMTGQSKEQYRLEKQNSSIRSIRNALSSYYSQKKIYPASLDELLTTKTTYGSYLLKSIPKDVYSDMPFAYTKSANDYSISYDIVLPDYVAGEAIGDVYEQDYFGDKSKIFLKVVNGRNTATSKNVSNEANAQSLKDTDLDKVPDVLEKYLGTNISKKDTDSDGYSDYDEIISGSNPSGPGKLKGGSGMFY
jgi:hypothetical protein